MVGGGRQYCSYAPPIELKWSSNCVMSSLYEGKERHGRGGASRSGGIEGDTGRGELSHRTWVPISLALGEEARGRRGESSPYLHAPECRQHGLWDIDDLLLITGMEG